MSLLIRSLTHKPLSPPTRYNTTRMLRKTSHSEHRYTRAQVHEQTHIMRQNTSTSAAVRDVTLSAPSGKGEIQHYYALFRPSLLAMVKFVGFPNVNLDDIKKEAEELEFHFFKGRTRVYMHQVLAAEMIQDWVRQLRKGVRNASKLRAEKNLKAQRAREENVVFKRAIATYKMYGSQPTAINVRSGMLKGDSDSENEDEEKTEDKKIVFRDDVKLDIGLSSENDDDEKD